MQDNDNQSLYNEGECLYISTITDIISPDGEINYAWMYRKREVKKVISAHGGFFYEFDDDFIENEMLCHLSFDECLKQVQYLNKIQD